MMHFDQWWFPDGETHLPTIMTRVNEHVRGRLVYQRSKYIHALELCRVPQVAVDVGAHVGLWSYLMVQNFSSVVAFEPRDDHVACWERNLAPWRARVQLHACALGATVGSVALRIKAHHSGNTRVIDGVGVPRCRLDDFQLPRIDLLKIDCEGYEVFVLEGGAETIQRCRPVIVVEQKPGCATRYGRQETAALALLDAWGAVCQWDAGGDFCFAWPES